MRGGEGRKQNGRERGEEEQGEGEEEEGVGGESGGRGRGVCLHSSRNEALLNFKEYS